MTKPKKLGWNQWRALRAFRQADNDEYGLMPTFTVRCFVKNEEAAQAFYNFGCTMFGSDSILNGTLEYIKGAPKDMAYLVELEVLFPDVD